MRRIFFTIVTVIFTVSVFAQTVNIIPKPVSLVTSQGNYILNAKTKLVVNKGDSESSKIATLLASLLSQPTGYALKMESKNAQAAQPASSIFLHTYKGNTQLGEEGYTLKVNAKGVTIAANTGKGLFYGIQSLLQLLPSDIEAKKIQHVKWSIPFVDITDYPRFGWRGLMLDVSRHFFTKEMVKDYINQMAKYKFNVFHWHLTDDNGWRMEIKGMPQLTDIGAWRVQRESPFLWVAHEDADPGEKATYGGFYTQDDIKEVIQYAKERQIEILPEIDVPAHSLALIASIPNISCTGLQYNVDPGTSFYAKKDNVVCVGNDSTYLVLDKIFTQVAELFPNKYIHMGGDEAYKGFWEKCPKCQKVMADNKLKNVQELQSYFVKRIEKMLNSKGKKLIGWDEILEGGLAPDATVMSWRGMKGGIEAAQQGHHVIMTPFERAYIDMYQGDTHIEPHSYGQVLLSSAYDFEPVPNGIDAKLILGGQGNLWAEAVASQRHAEYMVWPRGMALAEVFWTPKSKKDDYNTFVKRIESQFKRFDAADVNYAKSIYDPLVALVKEGKGADTVFKISVATQMPGLTTYYSFDTAEPDSHYPSYKGVPVTIPRGALQFRAINYRDEKPIGRPLIIKLKDLDKKLGRDTK